MPLLTYADLTAPAVSDPSMSVAQKSVARLTDPSSPMPPAGSTTPSSQEIATFQAWVSGGATQGSCGDAGDPYSTALTCTSNKYTRSSGGSPNMHPGGACITCHATGEGPRLTLAGTVYATAHEWDDCNGVGIRGAQVVITDANGKVTTIPVNDPTLGATTGNFMYALSIAKPFKAKVVYNGKERAMVATQTSGDCNSCHTENGANDAPGRIMLP
jgi:hypothetical protein